LYRIRGRVFALLHMVGFARHRDVQAPQTTSGISALIPLVLPHSPDKHPPHQPVIARKRRRIIVRTDRSRAVAIMWAAERDGEPRSINVSSGANHVGRRPWSESMIVGLDGYPIASPASNECEPQHLPSHRTAAWSSRTAVPLLGQPCRASAGHDRDQRQRHAQRQCHDNTLFHRCSYTVPSIAPSFSISAELSIQHAIRIPPAVCLPTGSAILRRCWSTTQRNPSMSPSRGIVGYRSISIGL
jgi:hypothetical protein